MKASEHLAKYLETEGVRYVFCVPGSPLMPILHAFYGSDSFVKCIIAKHEEGAAFMADGYARVTGGLGVCCGTTGPGTTNLITGVASSYRDSIPVLVLTAQVATSTFGKGAAQESTAEDRSFSSVELLKQITKYSAMVSNPDTLPFAVKAALRRALHPRMGPVHLNLPPDVMRTDIGPTDGILEKYRIDAAYFDRNKVKEAAKALLKAKSPVFLLGTGTLLSGAASEVIEIAEFLSIPVATTPKAKGVFPENHQLSLGVFGLAGTKISSEMILTEGKSDLVFAVGTGFNEWGTNGWDKRLKGNKVLIQIDVDPNQIGKNYPVNIGMVGDAATVLKELWFEIGREMKKGEYLIERTADSVSELKEKFPLFDEAETMNSDAVPIKPQRLMKDLREAVPEDGIFFVDSGNNMLWALHYLTITKPETFFIALGFASMGYSIAAAIGGKLAAPEKPVIAICGDGGFFMHGLEIATAVNYGIPAIWVILNDARLNMIYQAEKLQKMPGIENCEFMPSDIAMVARGLGARGIRIETPGDIVPAVKEAIACREPTVLDVVIDRDEISPLKKRIEAIQKFMKA